MIFEIIPLDFSKSHDQGARLLYDFLNLSGSRLFKNFSEFVKFKKEELALETRWDYVLKKRDFPIGVLTINSTYQEPEPLFFLKIEIDNKNLHPETKALIKNWLKREQVDRRFNKIISYVTSPYLEQYLQDVGGRVVNWLYFYELNIREIDISILNRWDNEKLLDKYDLKLEYYDLIPEELMEEHAKLHTQLSNDILRKDYSWTVNKSAGYTRNRQKLLSLKGLRFELAYLIDKEDTMAGMTKIVYDPTTPERVYQTITGVSREFRELGLAKLLKANMVKHIMEHYPQVKTIETDCLRGSIPMMLINENLGFRRKSDRVEKEIIIDELLL